MTQIHELRAGSGAASRQSSLDQPSFRDLVARGLGIVQKHRVMVLLAMGVVLAAGLGINTIQPRLYTASSKIVIHPRAPRVLDKVKEVQDDSLARGWGGLEPVSYTHLTLPTILLV